jgi:hypothetical protein
MSVKKTTKKQESPKRYAKPVVKKGPVLSHVATKIVSGEAAPCWIARAAFGADDFRWMIFRAWLLDDAPAWFRGLYIRFGERLGALIEGRETTRKLVRRAMDPVIRRKICT